MKHMSYKEKSSLISKLDYEITKAIFNGNKSVMDDKFQERRDIILKLPNSVWALGTKQN